MVERSSAINHTYIFYMKKIHAVTFLLLVVGGVNWLLWGLFGWEIGMLFGGNMAMASRAIYVLVGLSAIYEIAIHKNSCKLCNSSETTGAAMP